MVNVTSQLKQVYGALQVPRRSLFSGEPENFSLGDCESTSFHQCEMRFKSMSGWLQNFCRQLHNNSSCPAVLWVPIQLHMLKHRKWAKTMILCYVREKEMTMQNQNYRTQNNNFNQCHREKKPWYVIMDVKKMQHIEALCTIYIPKWNY